MLADSGELVRVGIVLGSNIFDLEVDVVLVQYAEEVLEGGHQCLRP